MMVFFAFPPEKVDSRNDPVVTGGAEGVSPRLRIVERLPIRPASSRPWDDGQTRIDRLHVRRLSGARSAQYDAVASRLRQADRRATDAHTNASKTHSNQGCGGRLSLS